VATIQRSLKLATTSPVNGLRSIRELHDRDPFPPETLRVGKIALQPDRVDVVAEINDLVIAIADKTGTCLHEGDVEALRKLRRGYQEPKPAKPVREVLAVYLKTGDEAHFDAVESHGLKPFLRPHLLALLRQNKRLLSQNAIVGDFYALLEKKEADVNAWRHAPVADWTQEPTPWIGFFERLRTAFSGLSWRYVPNPSGGFLGAWWPWRTWKDGAGVYLQIKEDLTSILRCRIASKFLLATNSPTV
jgi:hypothetical protein